MFDPKVIIALDYDNDAAALDFVSRIDPSTCNLKVGKELFTIAGPKLVSKLVDLNFRVFLDLKFHDIPNTTAQAIKAAASLGVWMVNVHASGGRVMMEKVANELDKLPQGAHRPIVIGDVMTKSPKTITARELAVEAVKALGDYRCNQLLVVDGVKLVGAITMHDLMRAKII